MADDSNPGSGKPAPTVLDAAFGALTKDALQPFQPTRAIEGASFPATLMAYRQLKEVAKDVATFVRAKGVRRVWVQSGDDVSDLSEYMTFVPRLDSLTKCLVEDVAAARQLLDQQPGAGSETVSSETRLSFAAGTVGAAISAAVAILGTFLNRDIKVQNAPVAIEDDTFALLVAKDLATTRTDPDLADASDSDSGQSGLEVVFPTVFALPATARKNSLARFALLPKLEALSKEGRKLRAVLGEIQERLGGPGTAARDVSKPNLDREELAGMKARLEGSVGVLKTAEDGFGAIAHRMLRADAKHTFLEDTGKGEGHLLAVHVIAGGGATRNASLGPWSNVYHSGGVIVRYILFKGGRFDSADILSRHGTAEEKDGKHMEWQAEL